MYQGRRFVLLDFQNQLLLFSVTLLETKDFDIELVPTSIRTLMTIDALVDKCKALDMLPMCKDADGVTDDCTFVKGKYLWNLLKALVYFLNIVQWI